MKRKLDSNDAPTIEVSSNAGKPNTVTFDSFGLDERILQAVSESQYASPTPIQAKVIPLALDGKDILARSKTGSGKTAAYIIPAIQSILRKKKVTPKEKVIATLVLVPTRELAEQVHKSFSTLAKFCSKEVRSLNLTQRVSDAVLKAALSDFPDIVVTTPGRAQQFLNSQDLSLERLSILIVDEADLVLSYGYEDDINTIAHSVPRGVQTFLMSATLTSEVGNLKDLFLHNPEIIEIDEKEEQGEGVSQYVVKCAEDEKFLLIFVIFRLRLVQGKCIIFVENVDRSYRLKLYLEQFGIKSCVLNAELPVNSRLHVVQEFNKGLYDILIAADDQEVLGGVPTSKKEDQIAENDDEEAEDQISYNNAIQASDQNEPDKKKQRLRKGLDFGVSRGIDFQNVACVINFDLPKTSKSYTHRIGRTARAGKAGMALSFVIPSEQFGKHRPTSISSAKNDEKVLEKIITRQAKKGKEIKPYNFDMAQVDSFRYRMNDALRAVTRVAITQARTREIKQELIKSEKLRKHFDENPDDLRHLRHDEDHGTVKVQPHLKHVPSYLMPSKGRAGLSQDEIGFVGFKKRSENRINSSHQKKKGGKKRFTAKNKPGKTDPLKSFRSR